MSVFEKVTDVGLEILTDTEIDEMIEELENEKDRRETLNKTNAVDEILEVLHKNTKPLNLAWITLRDGGDFDLDALIDAFENYRKRL